MSSFNNTEQNEPNLLGNLSYDKIRQKTKDEEGTDKKDALDEIMKHLDNYSTTQTNMEFELLANPKKMVADADMTLFNDYSHHEKSHKHSSEHRHSSDSDRHYSNHHNDHHDSHHHNTSDKNESYHPQTLNDLMNHQESNDNKNTNYPTPKAGKSGPSYGTGPNIPAQIINNDKYEGFATEEELLLGKLTMLRKLGEYVTNHGVILSQNYSMSSSYKSMKYEFDLHRDIRDKYNGTRWLGDMLCGLCRGIELANDHFDPFGFKLTGWSTQITEDRAEYYDVLAELYEKWFKSGKPIPPELKLGFMICYSAGSFHMQKSILGDGPNLKDEMEKNPELARKLKEQSIRAEQEKIKQQHEKNKTIFENTVNKQHESVVNKINDLNTLKKQEQEFMNIKNQEQVQLQEQQKLFQKQLNMQEKQMMHQQIMQEQLLKKQMQLEELQKQLNLQRSDCKSNYTETSYTDHNKYNKHNEQKTMSKPYIPASLQNKFNVITNNRPISKPNITTEYNNSINMGMGVGAIMTQDNNKHMNDNASIDNDIDNIISRGLETNSYDTESRSKHEKTKRKVGRPKKNTNSIKINT